MSAPSECGFVSPLALQLAQFLALKHAMGYRYREEGRVLRDLDRFLNTRLSADDPLVTPAVVHDYVARRGAESETTRAHRLTLIREACRFLRLDDARVVVPDRRSLRIVRHKFVPRVLSRDEGGRFLQACTQLPPGQGLPYVRLFLAPRCVFSTWLGCELENYCGLRKPTSISIPAPCISVTANSTNRGWCRSLRIWSSALFSAASLRRRLRPCRPGTPLFPSPHGGQYSITALRGAFHDALIAGIKRTPDSRIRLHDLRHYAEFRTMPSKSRLMQRQPENERGCQSASG